MSRILVLICLLWTHLSIGAENFLPENILLLDSKFTHHVLLVEKSSHTLFVYENAQGFPRLVKKYKVTTGKFRGDKFIEGDRKTPEGIYHIQQFLSKEQLFKQSGDYAKIYGSGAFTLDYPNVIDQREGKTGGGIWIHSTDDDARVDLGLDSRGCVVLANADLKDLSQFLDIDKTPVIITQEARFLPQATWERMRSDLQKTLQDWMTAWKDRQFNQYISYYHQTEFKDRSKGSYAGYKSYKQAVFARPDGWNIAFDFLSILATKDYVVAQLQQDYHSKVINDVGKKTLYLKRDSNYDWKIITELWSRVDDAGNVAFTPVRFFP